MTTRKVQTPGAKETPQPTAETSTTNDLVEQASAEQPTAEAQAPESVSKEEYEAVLAELEKAKQALKTKETSKATETKSEEVAPKRTRPVVGKNGWTQEEY